jgi:glyoxylase-like metal-dependent hydrolase (beta-lactamase superfamily II)
MAHLQLNQLTQHIYWLPPDETTDRPILGVIIGQHGTLIVDAGNSPAHAKLLLDELSKIDSPSPKYLTLTHWHWDHVFGTAAFDIPAIAYCETNRIVAEMTHLDWSDEALDRRVAEGTEIGFCRDMIKAELPNRANLKLRAPDISFVDQIDIDLGSITCRVVHVGGDHAADSSIVVIPEEKVIFLGDCIYPDLHSGAPNYTTQQLFPLIDRLLSYQAIFYLLAHNPQPVPRAEFVDYAALLKTIGHTVEQIGHNRELILQELQNVDGLLLDEDTLEDIDAFLAGLQKS